MFEDTNKQFIVENELDYLDHDIINYQIYLNSIDEGTDSTDKSLLILDFVHKVDSSEVW